jgi:PPOX class probable F420-dependent enzyme
MSPTEPPTPAPLTDEARAFLDAHVVGRLATAGADGEPHVVPLCFARIGDCVYFIADDKPKRHGPKRLKRLRNLGANPRAALLVDDYADDWQRLACLLLHLDAAVVSDPGEYAAGLRALRARYPAYRAMPLTLADHPMVRLTPRRWHLWRAASSLRPS